MMCKGASVRVTKPGARLDTATDRRVISLCNQIDLPALEPPVRANVGIAREEGGQQGQDVVCAERQAHADLEHAGGLAAIGASVRDRRLQPLHMILHGEQEALAGLGQSQLPGRSLKQPDTEIALQHRHVAADRRRGQGKPSRCNREAAGFRAADEGFEVGQCLHGLSSSDACKNYQSLPTNSRPIKGR